MTDPVLAIATFPADFCRQLALALNRWSSGRCRPVGTHVEVDGLVWYVQLNETDVHAFVKLHADGVEPGSEIVAVLTGHRVNESLEFRLSSTDAASILFVCDKVTAGAESVHLTGSVQVAPAADLAMAA